MQTDATPQPKVVTRRHELEDGRWLVTVIVDGLPVHHETFAAEIDHATAHTVATTRWRIQLGKKCAPEARAVLDAYDLRQQA